MSASALKNAQYTLSAFDVHLWSQRYDPAAFNPKIHFLWSESDYRKTRDAGQKIELDKLVLFPLKNELSAERNRFWYRYDAAVENMPAGAATTLGDTREFLWPLRCRPKALKLSFSASKAPVPPKVRATIWLWPFGWSSTIEFKVTAPYSLGDLRDLGMKIRAKEPAPFTLDGKPLALSGVMQRLADMVRQDLAAPGLTPRDITRVPRHFVFSLQLPHGQAVPANVSGWPDGDQLRMIGALRGGEVQPGQLLNSGVSFTPLGDRNFALTDFDQGTLLVLRHWKDRPGATRETNHCLFANLRTFASVYLALNGFAYAKGHPDIASAMENAKTMLSALPEEYRNGLCVKFKKHFSPPG
jgi:hypothetical protein